LLTVYFEQFLNSVLSQFARVVDHI